MCTCAAKNQIARTLPRRARNCPPTDRLHQQFRDELSEAWSRARRPQTLIETAIKRLEGPLDQALPVFELDEYDEEAFPLKTVGHP